MICLISMGVFYLTRAMLGNRGQNAKIVEISKMTYGIYLSHFFLIYFLKSLSWSVWTFYMAWIVTILVDIALIQILRIMSARLSRLMMRY